MGKVGITAFGGYIPESRLERSAIFDANAWAAPGLKGLARGARAAANWDEDSITMAVEAARDALPTAPEDNSSRRSVERLIFASTTMPFADRQNAALVAEALALDEDVSALDMGGSLKAATSALLTALRTAQQGTTVITAADQRRARPASQQEMLYGDAAAAVVVGTERPLATLIASHSINRDLVDHYRAADCAFDYTLEERWVREEGYLKIVPAAVERLLAKAGTSPDAIDHFILPCPLRGLPEKLAAGLGVRSAAVHDNLGAGCGFTGAAHSLLMLAHCLEQAKPGARVLLVGFGQGADVLLFEVTDAIGEFRPARGVANALAHGTSDSNYMRFLSHNNLVELDWGMRAERDNRTALSTFYRKRDMVTAFEGGKCSRCGTVQFPRTHICVNPNCGAAGTQDPYPFSDLVGRIKSFTEDWQAFCPDPPLKYGNISFDGGGNVMMEMADFTVGEARVGMPVRMVFRIKDYDSRRNFRRYFWKAAPVRGASERT
ncbi:MAG: hydroxymethylglutaryl-CoA synthase family protein [Alphaproteobacteria bacterium]|nr:MAG: hydroxymethylglutaryl-CoA synthase family protein [Alphaproteobacteria bacterium]